MKTKLPAVLVAMLLLTAPVPSASAQPPSAGFQLAFLRDIDVEIAGLLDAYLEAVPECPVRADTPVRPWVLDVALLRVGGAIETAAGLDVSSFGDPFPVTEWEDYLLTAADLRDVFRAISETCHSDSVPDSLTSIGLEGDLLRADARWREAESRLYERLAEEGYHE